MRLIFLSCLIALSACQQHEGDILEAIKQQKKLIVVTRNAPTTYYELRDELVGPEYDLTQAFASSLGVEVQYILKDSVSEILTAIQNGEAHIAAAGLTKTQQRENSLLFGPIYQEIQQQLVCRRGGASPKQIVDLIGLQIVIPEASSYDENLQSLKQSHTELDWQTINDKSTEDLIEMVWQKKIDCTVADSNIVAINQRYFPEVRVRFSITEPESLAWAMPKNATALNHAIEAWFDEFKQNGKLEELLNRYYGHIDEFDYVDTARFISRINTVLPKYKSHFIAAANEHKIDWLQLAAQAYQESHWRAKARSPTGVRGIMMLTLTTAKEMGVTSRLDPAQSIMGGAGYYKNLYDRVPDAITEPDRAWIALAAYNVGLGHIRDARVLAQQLGKDPDKWADLSLVLPLLSQKKYYKTLKHGYARGQEPVNYVQRIRDYHDILRHATADL